MTLRRTPMKRGTSKINSRSQKTIDNQSQRDEVRRVSLERAGHRCQMAALIPEMPCSGRLEVDEVEGRGINPGSHLDLDATQVGCRSHHQWKTEHPALALERGLKRKSSYELRLNMQYE